MDISSIRSMADKIKESMTVDEDGEVSIPASVFFDTLPAGITVHDVIEYNRSVDALSKHIRDNVSSLI